MGFFKPDGFGFGVKTLPVTLNELSEREIFLSWV
jgi:hypothetical protein